MTSPPQPPKLSREDKIDRQVESTFPASDPPSFSGGNPILGAPEGRASTVPAPRKTIEKAGRKKTRPARRG